MGRRTSANHMRLRTFTAISLATSLAAVLAAPGQALASRDAEVSIMDDQLLLGRSQGHIDRQMDTFRALGVDRIRLSAFWNGSAPAASSRTKPAGFDAANHTDPRYSWSALDRVVNTAASRGIAVMLSITTPAPRWATRGPNNLWRPSPAEFGAYASAVASRYAGIVDQYGISNEPNQGGWLQPQSTRSGLVSPHHYRAMVRAAYPRIKAADPGAVALIGNLSSSGSGARGRRAPIRPLAFLRAMACVDRRYRAIRRGACRSFAPVPADAVAHHPYQFFAPPGRQSRNRDDAGIGDGRRLLRVLDALVRRRRIIASGRRLSVYYTEFGYQTNPPDPFAGISLRRHSRYLQQAAYLVWRTPRLRAINQFRLTDGSIRGRGFAAFREFQSGLMFASRRPKPAFRSFPHPFVISGSRFWGQVRPGGAHLVEIQHRSRGAGGFRTLRRVRTDPRGYFSARLGRRPGQWRYRYSDGPSGTSDVLRVR